MKEGVLGLSVSEPGNMATPLPSRERVAAVAGVDGERLETEEEHRISAIHALYSVKRRKNAHCRVCMGEEQAGAQSGGPRRHGKDMHVVSGQWGTSFPLHV